MDKDILIKGNTVYSPETVSFVPKIINALFIRSVKNERNYPLGVFIEKDKNKFRACIKFMGKNKKLGTFNTAEDAFKQYKEYKENLIKDMAEEYRDRIPDKIYRAMICREVEITD